MEPRNDHAARRRIGWFAPAIVVALEERSGCGDWARAESEGESEVVRLFMVEMSSSSEGDGDFDESTPRRNVVDEVCQTQDTSRRRNAPTIHLSAPRAPNLRRALRSDSSSSSISVFLVLSSSLIGGTGGPPGRLFAPVGAGCGTGAGGKTLAKKSSGSSRTCDRTSMRGEASSSLLPPPFLFLFLSL